MIPEGISIDYPAIPVPVLHRTAADAGALPRPTSLSEAFASRISGTGSNYYAVKYLGRHPGYELFPVSHETASGSEPFQPYVQLMRDIQHGFGRTMGRLATVFGVSRQTLYDWRSGGIPNPVHEVKLVQLAAAARVFSDVGFKPTSVMLDRTVSDGKSLLTLIAEGSDGATAAQTLIRIVQRDLAARSRLDRVLAGRPPPQLDASDFGAPAFDEDA